jgi:hypothetical protein
LLVIKDINPFFILDDSYASTAYSENIAAHTGCLMKNASTHNSVIYYPTPTNKKIKDMAFQALRNSHKTSSPWRHPQ